jgi:hypothetical protein
LPYIWCGFCGNNIQGRIPRITQDVKKPQETNKKFSRNFTKTLPTIKKPTKKLNHPHGYPDYHPGYPGHPGYQYIYH